MSGLLVSAAHKSSGKTTISLGLCAALARRDVTIQPFKKGPDYIDPLWLSLACARPCYNLDFNTQSHQEITRLYQRGSAGAAFSLLEGNKGLYDGLELDGSNSNAALAAQLNLPVLLVIDCQGMTRGVAPLVLGYLNFEPKVRIAGIILNKLGGERHERKLRAVLAHYTDIPVVGAVQRHPDLLIDERHLGLVPSNEADQAKAKLAILADHIERQVDLAAVQAIAASAASTLNADTVDATPAPQPLSPPPPADVRIGIARDQAFAFYYPDDLERMRQCGATPVFFDTLNDRQLPDVDGLFLGGGFPETQLERLQANRSLRADIHRQIKQGLPTYAECGGLMYLSQSIQWGDHTAEMVGIIPARSTMHERPIGRGYTHLQETAAMPWPGVQPSSAGGHSMRAHEFHHSSLDGLPDSQSFAFEVLRGTGINGHHDGYIYKNLLACYIHQRNTQANPWVDRFIAFVRQNNTTSPS